MASSRRRITNLSCAWISASGGGATFTPSATSFSSSSVGTCSWSNVKRVGTLGRAAERIEVGVRADHHVGCDLSRRIVRLRRPARAALAERDRGLMRHPCQLPAADHGHQRGRAAGRRHSVHGVMAAGAVTCSGTRHLPDFRRLRCCVLHRCHDRAAASPDPAVRRAASRAHQVRDRRRDDVRHRLGGVLHAQADGAGAQAGDREDHRGHRRGDRVLHPEPRMELPGSRRPRATSRGADVFRVQRCRRADVHGPAVVLQLRPAAARARRVADRREHRRLHLGLHHRQPAADGVPVLGVPALGVPRRVRPRPDKAVESTFTAGGIAEAMEDVHEAHEASNVTPLQRKRRRQRLPEDRLSDSSPPSVSKTS